MRLIAVLGFLVATVIVPFAIWGEQIEAMLSIEHAVAWLRETPWSVPLIIALMAADILLPVPSTALTSALGIVHGPLIGAVIALAGALLGAATGYALCRALGKTAAERLAGKEGLDQARALLNRWGFPVIALSRWVPVLPEALTFLAGLIRLPFPWFMAAVACGAAPKALVFSTIGHLGRDMPVPVILAAAVAPVALAVVGRWVVRRHQRADAPGREV